MWIRYGPKYTIDNPNTITIHSEVLAHPGGVRYTANIQVTMRNRDIYPLTVNVDSLKVNLEQIMGWQKLPVTLNNHNGIGAVEIQPKKLHEFPKVVASLDWHGDIRRFINCKIRCLGIQGINVVLRGNYRELHIGKYRKPERDFHIGII